MPLQLVKTEWEIGFSERALCCLIYLAMVVLVEYQTHHQASGWYQGCVFGRFDAGPGGPGVLLCTAAGYTYGRTGDSHAVYDRNRILGQGSLCSGALAGYFDYCNSQFVWLCAKIKRV